MQRPIIAAVDDMFFAAKIRAVAEHLGIEVRFARNLPAALAAAREMNEALMIVDLHSQQCDAFALARSLKADEQLQCVALLGFFSHVQTALMEQAKQAGYDFVLPRSVFTKRLPEILQGEIEKE